GLTAAATAAGRGARVLCVGKGWGTTHFRSGTVDVLGYLHGEAVRSPQEGIQRLTQEIPDHPYATIARGLEGGLRLVREALGAAGIGTLGSPAENRLLATAAGTFRPTCLLPQSLNAGWQGARILAVGLHGYRDFEPDLFAAVLPGRAERLGLTVRARATTVDVPQLHRHHLDGMALARLLDGHVFPHQLATAVRARIGSATLLCLPAVLGLEDSSAVVSALEQNLGTPVVEVPTLPPSVPGIRLAQALERAARSRGARIQVGRPLSVVREASRAVALRIHGAAHETLIPLDRLVLATGGLASGGLVVDGRGLVREAVAGLPVRQPEGPVEDWYREDLLGPAQPVATAGLRFDQHLRPLSEEGEPVENVFCCGGLLAGARRSQELSADGIAVASGHLAAKEALAA
ncbi:MAG: anaerobic glycerol-3-phosphate dehydrogenase subunit B, partial [Candidatus Dormibacteraeota bacterium]|nr:anaerobic glycerol-3-phosphate dehydrogenase subunit B [Candidatus Dormibacteraeota bacterium]